MIIENRNLLEDKKKVDLAIPGSWGHVHFIHESVTIASHAINRAIAAEGQLESLQKENERLRHRDRVVSLTNETLGRYVREGKEQIKSQKEEIERWNSLRPEVQWFAEQMEIALRDNDYKSGWKDEHQSWLLGELHRNAGKIFDSRYSLRQLVNTANFAMMIADNARVQEGEK